MPGISAGWFRTAVAVSDSWARDRRWRLQWHERIVCHGTEIRENVIGGHIEQTAANSSQNVYTPEMLCREETQEQCTEPVKPQHIEKNVHESCMHEHICQ